MANQSTPAQHSFNEVFCSDLPSPCNLYLSGKRCSRLVGGRVVPSAHHSDRHRHHHHHHPRKNKRASSSSTPIMRFATECHSLTLLRKDGSADNSSGGGDDGYHLSVSRLPSSASDSAHQKGAEKKKAEGKNAKAPDGKSETISTKDMEEGNGVDICLGHSSVFWEDLPRAYQIDFDVFDKCDKTAESKRHIHFKFGYIGGDQHDLIVSWSIEYGNWTVSLNGKEIFCNEPDTSVPPEERLRYSWRDEAGHTLQVNMHAAPQSPGESNPDWRQYDFLIDGMSFFHMPKLSQMDHDVNIIGSSSSHSNQHQESSVEVFAMMKNTPVVDNPNSKEHKGSDNNSLTTHASQDTGGADVTDQKSSSATADATTALSSRNEGVESTTALPSNYYLQVKSRVFLEHPEDKHGAMQNQSNDGLVKPGADNPTKPSRMASAVETIPLDFRPMSVHVTELHVVSKDAKSRSSGPTAIGIFVASVDDNKLYLYVSTKESLQRRIVDRVHRGKSCFVPISLKDIAAAPEATGHDMADGSMSESFSDDQDDSMSATIHDDSFLFSSPIMTIECCVSDAVCPPASSCDQGEFDMKLNRLAIACYDGTIRIYTYQLKTSKRDKDGDASILQFHHLQWSAFIVDGPVVSLRFGEANASDFPPSPSSSLYLVAGSLCGFACVFYESSQPSSCGSSQSISNRSFDGPVTVVDGLYDAKQEECEDCVTAVSLTENQMIAVGTQGGRVLLFKQCQNERNAYVRRLNNDLKEEEHLRSQIAPTESEISQLQYHIEEMNGTRDILNNIISDIQSKIQDLTDKMPPTTSEDDEALAGTVESGEWEIVQGNEAETEPNHDNSTSGVSTQTTSGDDDAPDGTVESGGLAIVLENEAETEENLDNNTSGISTNTTSGDDKALDGTVESDESAVALENEAGTEQEHNNSTSGDDKAPDSAVVSGELANVLGDDAETERREDDNSISGNDAAPSELANVLGEKAETEPKDDNSTSGISMASNELPHFQSELKAAQTELLPLEQNMAARASKISELSSHLDAIKKRLAEIRTNKLCQDTTQSHILRVLHRYEFVWDGHLPYPIHGLAFDEDGDELFVSTRRSVHVFRLSPAISHELQFNDIASTVEKRIDILLAA